MAETRDGAVDLALLEPILERYTGERGTLIPVLQKAQEIYGYLPREVLQFIARRLGLSLGKVYGVATFYAQFYLEKRGRHVLKVCDGTACHVKGAPALLEAVEDEFGIHPGETSPDGELTVDIVYCMGSCALAPVAVLDNQVTGRVQSDALLRKVKKQVGPKEEALEVTDG
jgi:NADH-quinone oxidoreductase subunit E